MSLSSSSVTFVALTNDDYDRDDAMMAATNCKWHIQAGLNIVSVVASWVRDGWIFGGTI